MYQNKSMCILRRESIHMWRCNRALGCIDIPNFFLHTSQVYVYVHLTNKKNLTSNSNLPMDYPLLCMNNRFHGNCVYSDKP